MALEGLVQQALVRCILPCERKIYCQFDWIVIAQVYDDIINNIYFIQRTKKSNSTAGSSHFQQSVVLNHEQEALINNLTGEFNGLIIIQRYLIICAAEVGKSVVLNEIVKIAE